MAVEQVVESEVALDDVRVVAIDRWSDRRQLMRRLLEHSFKASEIVEADSRSAALELVRRHQPELVIVEIQMPLEEGLEIISELHQISPRPRVVVCSFRHDAATVAAALDRGADAYLAKPAGIADLRAALGAALPEAAVRHRPPKERPVSPSPLGHPASGIETQATP